MSVTFRPIDHPNQLKKDEGGYLSNGRAFIGLGFNHYIEFNTTVVGAQNVQPVVKPGAGGGGSGSGLSVTGLDGVLRVVSDTLQGNASTTDLPEGTNLYYTLPRTVLAGYGASAVGTDAYAITVTGITALAVGDRFSFLADVANTGAATLQVNSLPVVAAAILKQHDTALATGDIEAGQIVSVVWDGTVWQMQSQAAQIDHGETVGKSDDDHAQYLLLAGRTPVDTETGTRIILPAGTAAASTAPLKLTSGPLMTITEMGAIEFLTDRYYAGITTSSAVFTSQYPPAQSDTYVKSTTKRAADYEPYRATDPTKSLTGAEATNGWSSLASTVTNQRFHIDLGASKTITRIYYENGHTSGSNTNRGAKTLTFWGSNTAGDFADLTYANNGTWVQLTTSQGTFDQHVSADTVDPKYITVTNSTAYRYYAFKFADNWGATTYMSVRRIELQSAEDPLVRRQIQLAQVAGLTSTRVPFANAAGELTDDADFTFASNRLTTWLTLPAGTATAATAPLKFTSGVSLTTAEAGAVEFTTDDYFATITTGAARKRLLMADPVGGLTATRVPVATTNGRLTDDADLTFDTDTLTATKYKSTTPLGYGEMYMYGNTTVCLIDVVDVYHAVYNTWGNNDGTLAPLRDTTYWTYTAGVAATISTFADYNAPTSTQTLITTSSSHNMLAGEPITITGATVQVGGYNGTYMIVSAPSNVQLVITKTYIADATTPAVRRPGTLKCLVAGIYDASFTMSGTVANPNDNLKWELNKDTTALDNIAARAIWSSTTKYESVSSRGLASLTAGQYVWLSVKNYSGTGDVTFYSGNLCIRRLL